MTYTINYWEKTAYEFEVEADSPDAALNYFYNNGGYFDYNNGFVCDSGVSTVEWKDDNGSMNEMKCD